MVILWSSWNLSKHFCLVYNFYVFTSNLVRNALRLIVDTLLFPLVLFLISSLSTTFLLLFNSCFLSWFVTSANHVILEIHVFLEIFNFDKSFVLLLLCTFIWLYTSFSLPLIVLLFYFSSFHLCDFYHWFVSKRT